MTDVSPEPCFRVRLYTGGKLTLDDTATASDPRLPQLVQAAMDASVAAHSELLPWLVAVDDGVTAVVVGTDPTCAPRGAAVLAGPGPFTEVIEAATAHWRNR